MRRAEVVPVPAFDGAVGSLRFHPLAAADPASAAAVLTSWTEYVLPGTRSSYASGVKKYVAWCGCRGLSPWPTDEALLCGWMHFLALTVKPTSMRMYLAAVRYQQGLEGFPWKLDGNDKVHRSMTYLKRKFPSGPQPFKFAVDLRTLQRVLRHIPGWPSPLGMSHNDRVFAAASLAAVCGFLRGGEFLFYPSSDRRTLRQGDVSVSGDIPSPRTLRLRIPQPKTMWWVKFSEVFIHERPGVFCPVRWWCAVASYDPIQRSSSSPAFRLDDGSALSKVFMLRRTADLLAAAGIAIVDAKGVPTTVRAASWRAGAVKSAVAAGTPTHIIKSLGRWSSDAWQAYLQDSNVVLRAAVHEMWKSSSVAVV